MHVFNPRRNRIWHVCLHHPCITTKLGTIYLKIKSNVPVEIWGKLQSWSISLWYIYIYTHTYINYKTQLILNLKSIFCYLRLKFIWVNSTAEILLDIISPLKLSLHYSQMCGTHIGTYLIDKKSLKLGISCTYWIIFYPHTKKKTKTHFFHFIF